MDAMDALVRTHAWVSMGAKALNHSRHGFAKKRQLSKKRATVHMNRLAGDIARLRPAQETDHAGDVLGPAALTGQRAVGQVVRGSSRRSLAARSALVRPG